MEVRGPVGADNQLSFSVSPNSRGNISKGRTDIEEDGMVTSFYSFTKPGDMESVATGLIALVLLNLYLPFNLIRVCKALNHSLKIMCLPKYKRG